MEALQESRIYGGETDRRGKLAPDKDWCDCGTPQVDSNYVDLDDFYVGKPESAKTVKVTFTGDGSQLAIYKCNSDTPETAGQSPDPRLGYLPQQDCKTCNEHDRLSAQTPSDAQSDDDFRDCAKSPFDNREGMRGQKGTHNCNLKKPSLESEELQYTDMYLNGRRESEDTVSAAANSETSQEDESHYITTHEIQLLELDHEVDYEMGRGSSWDVEDDNLVYSFVDYASFESGETIEEKASEHRQPNDRGADLRGAADGDTVGTKHRPEFCALNKCPIIGECTPQNPNIAGSAVGQIHLSIKATSRAINEKQKGVEKEDSCCCIRSGGDTNDYAFKGQGGRSEIICDRANCFIPAPGRVHIANKLKGKDINEYSSGASSSVSELDDADKEVRNLTTRAFRSLAGPYFDAINFSTSSESSTSEHGLGINRWSAFLDLKYGNVSQGREQSLVAQKCSSTVGINKSTEGKSINGLGLVNMKTSQTNTFGVSTRQSDSQSALSSTKKIELTGKFRPGQGRVVTLTETLNFCCNMQGGPAENQACGKFTENSTGSLSLDEVPAQQGNEISQPHDTEETVEDTHKKAIFASSLLKNVISKKMQFEQERKMERGEIRDSHPALSPLLLPSENETAREKTTEGETLGLQRQGSKFSEAGSGLSIISFEELEDIAESNSCELRDENYREESVTPTPETNFDSKDKDGNDIKQPASEGTQNTLLRSQNSAFRCWRDEEEKQKEAETNIKPNTDTAELTEKSDQTLLNSEAVNNRANKMSQLFVPSIQFQGEEVGKLVQKQACLLQEKVNPQGVHKEQANSSAQATDSLRNFSTKSPEIKIRLRSLKDNKRNPLNIANLLTPKIVSSASKPANDAKCQVFIPPVKGEPMEKIPQFTVRDIRDTKCKLQPPIYQVRDVRKMVKSSYHFVSLDNKENKVCAVEAGTHESSTQGPVSNIAPISPMVIKCQSVNTNSNEEKIVSCVPEQRLAEDLSQGRESPQTPTESTRNVGTSAGHTAGRLPVASTKQLKNEQCELAVRLKKEKLVDPGEKKMSNQAALEKLEAAVRTMEQLYVFDRNEWKRKTQAPEPITDSHVLSLITKEEKFAAGRLETGEDPDNSERVRTASNVSPNKVLPTDSAPLTQDALVKKEDKENLKSFHIPFNQTENSNVQTHHKTALINKNPFILSVKNKTATRSLVAAPACSLSPKPPLSLKSSQPQQGEENYLSTSEAIKSLSSQPGRSALSDSRTYLTVPVKSHTKGETITTCTFLPTVAKVKTQSLPSQPTDGDKKMQNAQTPQTTIITETQSPDTPTATICHHSLPMAQGGQPHVFCVTPPATPLLDPLQQTQRKMLLDPTTGHYYLVDTPVQPAMRRLFDPETGQFVDVPFSHHSVTPVPMPVSPLAISPGTYGPAYMLYPSFLPTQTAMPSRSQQSQASEVAGNGPTGKQVMQQENEAFSESPYYCPTQTPQCITTEGSPEGKPVISITSQQGPRIIAPPSFDGTTMSFVVEHT